MLLATFASLALKLEAISMLLWCMQETWRLLLRSQNDVLSAIALLAQAVSSTDPVLQQIYLRISDCQSNLEQVAQLLKTHATMNASIAQEMIADPLCSHLVSHIPCACS